MASFRFYLFALKGAAYLELRLGEPRSALARLRVIERLDPADRMGARVLMDVARSAPGNEFD